MVRGFKITWSLSNLIDRSLLSCFHTWSMFLSISLFIKMKVMLMEVCWYIYCHGTAMPLWGAEEGTPVFINSLQTTFCIHRNNIRRVILINTSSHHFIVTHMLPIFLWISTSSVWYTVLSLYPAAPVQSSFDSRCSHHTVSHCHKQL